MSIDGALCPWCDGPWEPGIVKSAALLTRDCEDCASTGRDTIPWAELFKGTRDARS